MPMYENRCFELAFKMLRWPTADLEIYPNSVNLSVELEGRRIEEDSRVNEKRVLVLEELHFEDILSYRKFD
jgi:hypothetical protein